MKKKITVVILALSMAAAPALGQNEALQMAERNIHTAGIALVVASWVLLNGLDRVMPPKKYQLSSMKELIRNFEKYQAAAKDLELGLKGNLPEQTLKELEMRKNHALSLIDQAYDGGVVKSQYPSVIEYQDNYEKAKTGINETKNYERLRYSLKVASWVGMLAGVGIMFNSEKVSEWIISNAQNPDDVKRTIANGSSEEIAAVIADLNFIAQAVADQDQLVE